MSTDISTVQLTPPKFRVLWADSLNCSVVDVFGAKVSQSDCTWNLLSEPEPGSVLGGVELLTLGRKSLPEVGKAVFRYVYGLFPTELVARPASLLNKEVRLQLQDQDGVWQTVFWGHVDYEEDQALVGEPSGVPQGCIMIHCLDGFARTMKWFMNRHGFDPLNDGTVGHQTLDAYGHPGFNYYLAADGPLIGNKSAYTYTQDGVDIKLHIWQGAFSTSFDSTTYAWADHEAIVNAVSTTKPAGEPWFDLKEGIFNYGSFSPIAVDPSENVHSFVSRVCGRRRGLGTVAVKWKDVDGGPYGQIQMWLGVTPLNPTSITFTYIVSGTMGQVDGASAYTDFGTGYNLQYETLQGDPLDLRGDQRNRDDLFFLGNMEGQQFDYVETVGEPIEVAMTGSLADCTGGMAGIYDHTKQASLEVRWSSTDRDTLEGLSIEKRVMDRWRHVYQAFGLPRIWQGESGTGLGEDGGTSRVDCRCKDDGSLYQPNGDFPVDTSPGVCEIMSNLPFYYGFDYSGTFPVRTDNSPSNGMPDRRPAQVYARPTDADEDRWFLPFGELPSTMTDKFNFQLYLGNFNPSVQVQPDSIQVVSQSFADLGLRAFADVTRDAALDDNHKMGCQYDITRLAITFAVRLPHRLRFCSSNSIPQVSVRVPTYAAGFADWQKARRKKSIYVPRAHLWLAHGSTIWDLSQTTISEEGFLALRQPLTANPFDMAILRDDRDRVQFYHMVAQYWYLNLRKRLRFGQSYCGLLPFKKLVSAAETTDRPVAINDHIETAFINGDVADPTTISTNCTSVEYDHQAQTTVWETDYFDLDFSV